jgi:hypothetical protein
MVMDIAQIPKSEGIDLDKWMYMFDNVGIAFINSFEEGKDKFQGQVSQFNQFQAVDMSLSSAVGQYNTILGKIEQTIDKIVGITPQREGSVQQHETVGGVEQAVSASSSITEPWFYMHNEIKKKVLGSLLETAKFAYKGQKKLNYILNDVQIQALNVDMDQFSDSDYGIFTTNSSKEHAAFQKLEGLAQQAMATGSPMSDIIEMYDSNSLAELKRHIKSSEQVRMQQEQQQGQQQQEMQQQQIQAQAQEKEAERAFEANESQLDRENEIRKVVISTMGFDTDTADNDVIDVVEQGKVAMMELDAERKNNLEQRKVSDDSVHKSEDRKLKREEIKSKERMNKDNNKTALKNKVSGEK